MVDEVDALIRARVDGTLGDDELRDWIERGMTMWSSPLALQGAHALNDSRFSHVTDREGLRSWWERESTAYRTDPEEWDRRYWVRYLTRLSAPSEVDDPDRGTDRRGRARRMTLRTARDLVQRGSIRQEDAEDVLRRVGLSWPDADVRSAD